MVASAVPEYTEMHSLLQQRNRPEAERQQGEDKPRRIDTRQSANTGTAKQQVHMQRR